MALYRDGIIREWEYQQRQRPNSTNLASGLNENESKIIALPGNDLTVSNDRFLFFYDRKEKNLKRIATIEVNPDFRLIKAGRDFLLLVETKGKQFRLCLVDLNKMAVVDSFVCSYSSLFNYPSASCFFGKNFGDGSPGAQISAPKDGPKGLLRLRVPPAFIPVKEKISCLASCKCSKLPGNYLLGLGLVNGAVQIWNIQVDEWSQTKLLEHPLHDQAKPIKDLSFIEGKKFCLAPKLGPLKVNL